MYTDDTYFSMLQQSEGLSVQSKRTYVSVLKNIIDYTKNHLCVALNQPKRTMAALKKLDIPHDRLLAMSKAMLALIKYTNIKEEFPELYQKWSNEFKPLDAEFRERMDKNMLSEKQARAMIPWERVLKVHESLGKRDYGCMDHVLLSMFCLIPPRRQIDYFRIRIYDGPASAEILAKDDPLASGYLDMHQNKPTITVVKYKTVDIYDTWTKELPANLGMIVRHSLQKTPRKYLFTTQGKPYNTVNNFTQYSNGVLKRLFKNDEFTVNILRHAFANYVHHQPFKSMEELKEIARDMGHSVMMSLTYVKK